MPQITEAELGEVTEACSRCSEYEGAIWLCGEGWFCERCFSELAEVPEERIFEEDFSVRDEDKSKVRQCLQNEAAKARQLTGEGGSE